MKNNFLKRVTLIAFFFGLNLVLGSYFLAQFKYPLPAVAVNFFSHFKLIPTDYQNNIGTFIGKVQPNLEADELIADVNGLRSDKGLSSLAIDPKLQEATELLFAEYKKHNFDSNKVDDQALERSLKKAGYEYEWVGNNVLIGPLTNDGVVETLEKDQKQLDTITNPDFTKTGVVASIETLHGAEIGVFIQLIAQPKTQSKKAITQSTGNVQPAQTQQASNVREIPDQEVIDSLNNYRLTHGRAALAVDDNLCEYAEKRANDLVSHGSLDGHAGFRKDFEDPENPPIGIKEYSGTSIGENLAHQFCKNMTSGQSFTADTGIALIEWCFDSSTKGHREAQLSTEFKNVCVRHGGNMYVVIFGS